MGLLGHRGAAADGGKTGLLVVPNQPVRIDIDDEGPLARITGLRAHRWPASRPVFRRAHRR